MLFVYLGILKVRNPYENIGFDDDDDAQNPYKFIRFGYDDDPKSLSIMRVVDDGEGDL